MSTKVTGVWYKSVYTSPLAEEIIVSFEENFLASEPSYLNNREGGENGTAGYHSGFEGKTYDNL